MRPLPEPMDGAGAGRSRSTDDDVTAYIPRLDDDRMGQVEHGWYERLRADVADSGGYARWPAPDPDGRPLLAAAPPLDMERVARHRADQSDLPGPSRRELARLIRQVRALVIAPYLVAAIWGAVELIDWHLTR